MAKVSLPSIDMVVPVDAEAEVEAALDALVDEPVVVDAEVEAPLDALVETALEPDVGPVVLTADECETELAALEVTSAPPAPPAPPVTPVSSPQPLPNAHPSATNVAHPQTPDFFMHATLSRYMPPFGGVTARFPTVAPVTRLSHRVTAAPDGARHDALMSSTASSLALRSAPSRAAPPRYADLETWRVYQGFFPPAMRCMPESTPIEEWWSWKGIDVHIDRMPVAEAPLKVIVLHGAGAYGRVMAPAAVIAQRNGYETVCPDLPGYGLTAVSRARFVYPLWVDCIVDLIEAELARDGRPVVLFGVSLGGLLAYQAAARSRKVVGLVATTLADPREPAVRQGFARTRLLGSAGLWMLDKLAPLTDGLPLPMRHMSKMDRISNITALSELCSHDPLGGGNWVPARFLRTLMSTAPDIEPEDFRVCPVLLAHPGVDRMTEISLSRRFFDRLAAPKRMVVLDGASHMPTEHPGVDQLEDAVVRFVDAIARGER